MDQTSQTQPNPLPSISCTSCNSPYIEAEYATPLCTKCRDTLVQRPIPAWIYAVAGIVLLVVIYSFFAFPSSLKIGIDDARAKKAEAAGNYTLAEANYAKVAGKYPDDLVTQGRLAVCAYKAGDYQTAANVLNGLSGKELNNDEADELTPISNDLEAKSNQAQQGAGAASSTTIGGQ